MCNNSLEICLITYISDTNLLGITIFRYGKSTFSIANGEGLAFLGIMNRGTDDGLLSILVKYDTTQNALCISYLEDHHR